jgi:predicted Zn-dependent protease with MMP-like domain
MPPTVSDRLTHRTDDPTRRQAEFRAGYGPVMDPTTVGEEHFERLVADALDSIPEELGTQMDNVAVVVEDWPTAEQLDGRGGTLLGLYEGIDITHRGPLEYAGVMPDRITIFKGPLCARARDEAELAEQVRVTVLHEVGHYFGISDERLDELGWA